MLRSSLFDFDLSEEKVPKQEAVRILSIKMDPNLLLLIMMTIVLFFFHEDLFGRNNSRSAKSFCSTGPRAGPQQDARPCDTKARGHYKTSGEPNH